MKRHYAQKKTQRQAEYLATFAEMLLARFPRLSGRIEWPAVQHYYHYGTPVTDAVDQYIIARNIT